MKTIPVHIRLSEETVKKLREIGENKGLKLGSFIRHILIRYLEDPNERGKI